MRAMVVPRYGPPEVFELRDVPEPTVGPGQVSIRVRYAGVNFTDVRNRRGDGLGVPPFIPGIEVAGTIEEVDENVTDLAPGMEVTSLTGGHGYAEKVVVDAWRVLPLPAALVGDPVSATAVGVVPSALNLLTFAGRVLPHETMLVHGAAGGVGSAMVQLTRVLGLGPIHGTVGSETKRAYAERLGFAEVHLRQGFADTLRAATDGRGVDVVFDPIGGATRATSFEVIAPGGRLVHYGNASMEPEVVPEATWLRARCVGYMGYSGGQHAGLDPDAVRASWVKGLELVASGRVSPDVTAVYPLDQAGRAHEVIERGGAVGKLVLRLD